MNNIKHIFYITVPVLSMVLAGNVLAGDSKPDSFSNPIGITSFEDVVAAILGVVVQIGTVLVVLAIIYAGFLFVTAQGNDEKISKAKNTFVWVVVGAIILLGSEMIAEVVCETAKGLSSDGDVLCD